MDSLHDVRGEVESLARDFDRHLREAAALTDKIEDALSALPRDCLAREARHYLRWPVIEAAVREAFTRQMPASLNGLERQALQFGMQLVLRQAGENLARARQREKEEAQ